MKIWWYDLPFAQIGCHMVIHDHRPDLFWIIYTIAGVALPLLGLIAVRKVKTSGILNRLQRRLPLRFTRQA